MSKLYISEYADMVQTVRGAAPIAQGPVLASQVVDFSGGVASSSAFNASTTYVRLHTDAICSIVFGTAPTATTSNKRMAADNTEYFGVPVGLSYKVSVIANT